jgi:hypothetical protein
VDTEEIFKAALAKYPVIDINARQEFKRLCILYPPENEGRRLLRDLGFLMCEYQNPSFKAGDTIAKNDLRNRFILTFEEIIDYAFPFRANPVLNGDLEELSAAKNFEEEVAIMDRFLQHARKLHAQKDKPAEEKRAPLCESISYSPGSNKVYFNNELVYEPRANSKERAIWNMLHQCKEVPRSVAFSDLRELKDSRGNYLFTNLGDAITSDIDKWNKKFGRFGVTVFCKDGDSIRLEVQPLKKKP